MRVCRCEHSSGFGTLYYFGSVSPFGSPRWIGSRKTFGTLRQLGSPYLSDAVILPGSPSLSGTLKQGGLLLIYDTFILTGSRKDQGTLWIKVLSRALARAISMVLSGEMARTHRMVLLSIEMARAISVVLYVMLGSIFSSGTLLLGWLASSFLELTTTLARSDFLALSSRMACSAFMMLY